MKNERWACVRVTCLCEHCSLLVNLRIKIIIDFLISTCEANSSVIHCAAHKANKSEFLWHALMINWANLILSHNEVDLKVLQLLSKSSRDKHRAICLPPHSDTLQADSSLRNILHLNQATSHRSSLMFSDRLSADQSRAEVNSWHLCLLPEGHAVGPRIWRVSLFKEC